MILSPEVADAVSAGAPVVALESTIIAHGFPRPRNLEVAVMLEAAVRRGGAVPATIAIMDGELIVGLDESQLERVAAVEIPKVNVANMTLALSSGGSGATTVSATVRAARLAGIRIVATGGIGGVHRGSDRDVSADLPELARGPIAVISSGAKAFLDLDATLAYLETVGVTVVGYETDELPAFYSRSSGIALDGRVDSPAEAARLVATVHDLAGAGLLVANPIPQAFDIDPREVTTWTNEAVAAADSQGVTGLGRTPFVLARIADLSGGKAVEANAALAENNASLAGLIAAAG